MTPLAAPTLCSTTDACFPALKEFVIVATGLSYYRDRNAEFAELVARRCERLGLPDCSSYWQLLNAGAEGELELDCLIEELTIGETYFFRHPELFHALEHTILPEAIDRNRKQRRLRIWSAGSSIGAEAYTVSILLRRTFAEQIRDWEITIIGTDINRSYLSRAVQARYEDWALRGTSDEIKQQCFTHRDGAWDLRPEYRQGVSFCYHNLARHPYPSLLHNLAAFDVVLCRNVMIYFSPPVTERIISSMRRCVVDGGWLLVGHAEHNPDLFADYSTIQFRGATAYRRIDRSESTGGPAYHVVPFDARFAEHSVVTPPPVAPHRPARLVPSARLTPPPSESSTVDDPLVELAALRALADQGFFEAAVVRCGKLVQRHKLNPSVHFYHALLLEQLGDHAQCERALRRAIYLDRSLATAHYYLAQTLQRLARPNEAAQALRTTRRLLAGGDSARLLDDAEGLTAADLDELARLQLEALGS